MESGVSTTRLDFDHDERFLPLRRQLGVTTFGINQLLLAPGQRSRIHRHTHQEEVYIVLEGVLTLLIEGEATDYAPGRVIRVAPDVRRQLVNRGPVRLAILAIGGAHEHNGRDGEAFTSWEQETPASPAEVPFPDDLPPSERRGDL